MLKHCLFSIPRYPSPIVLTKPSSLFLPVITTSHSPLTECDYNLHKSNSTYFSDLDITRTHLVCALFQPGIDKLQHNKNTKLVLGPDGNAVKGRWLIMLGAVECSFKREIKPYETYEMWSRILCWDRKWIYIVTHFVKAGTVRPKSYILGDGSWFGQRKYPVRKGEGDEIDVDVDEKAIFASAISKYVVKLGRLTVHPEVMMQASGMLPPKPGGWATISGGTAEGAHMNGNANGNANGAVTGGDDKWDWQRIEAENEKGLKFAEHFAALDGLQGEFSGSKKAALGRYRDFLLSG